MGRSGERVGHAYPHVNITVEMRRRKRHARDAPFVKSRGVWTYDRHVWIYVSPSDVNRHTKYGAFYTTD